MLAAESGTRISFGPFVFDLEERSLERRGVEVALPSRSLRLLETLDLGAIYEYLRTIEPVEQERPEEQSAG